MSDELADSIAGGLLLALGMGCLWYAFGFIAAIGIWFMFSAYSHD